MGESEVFDVVKDVFLPWYNTYRFFVENASRFEREYGRPVEYDPEVASKVTNEMDQWLLSRLQLCLQRMQGQMDSYRLYAVMPNLLKVLDELTHWYVTLNRKALKVQRGET